MRQRQAALHRWQSVGAVALGIVLVSIGLELFLAPHQIVPGGIKGVAIILSHVTEMKMGLLLLFINLPFVIFKSRSRGKTLAAVCTLFIIALLSLWLHPYPPFLQDPLLASAAGGITFGTGAGLIVRFGWYADGVNETAAYLKTKTKLSIAEMVMILNLILLGAVGFIFGWEQALHSIIAYFLAYKTLQFALDYRSLKLIALKDINTSTAQQLLPRMEEQFKDMQLLIPSASEITAGNTVIYFTLPCRRLREFRHWLAQLDLPPEVQVTYGNYSPSEPFYRL